MPSPALRAPLKALSSSSANVAPRAYRDTNIRGTMGDGARLWCPYGSGSSGAAARARPSASWNARTTSRSSRWHSQVAMRSG